MPGSLEFTRALAGTGIKASCGHTNATYAQFNAGMELGLSRLTHFCNQMTKLHHREIGLVGAGLLDNDVLNELICDKVHVFPDMIKLTFKSKPIDKIAIITDSLAATWLPDGEFDLGGLPIYVKNGEVRLVSNNALAGSTCKYNFGLRNVFEITGLPLSQLVKATSYNQARSLGLDKLGKIQPGYFADIVLLNKDFSVASTFVNGSCLFK